MCCMMRPQWTCVFVHPFILQRPSLSIDTKPQRPQKSNPYVFSLLIVMPQVFERFYKLTSLYFSYHVTSEQNISPEPEMVYWQWLTANPDRPYKVFCQTGFCSIHIQAAAVFTMGRNVTYLCLVERRNKNLKWITCGSLHFQHVGYSRRSR